MTIHEPMTMVTDLVLAAACVVFSISLWRAAFRPWSLAFAFTALGTLTGALYHGIGPQLHPRVDAALWKATVYSVGLASFFLLTGAAVASTSGRTRRAVGLFALAKFCLFATWMIMHDDFTWVILDYGTSMLVIAALFAAVWRLPASRRVIASVVVAIVAAVIQQARISITPQFDHNALYHVVQLYSLWLLYRGGIMMSETSRSMIQPT